MERIKNGYISAALWTSCDSEEIYFDSLYDETDFSEDALLRIKNDIALFCEKAGDLLETIDQEQIGHDLWLTRNGHGTGFWDRGLGEVGEKLTEIANSMGESSLYLGDDNNLYF